MKWYIWALIALAVVIIYGIYANKKKIWPFKNKAKLGEGVYIKANGKYYKMVKVGRQQVDTELECFADGTLTDASKVIISQG